MVRPRRAEQYLPKEDATPQRDARPQSIHNRGRRIPLRCPIPLREPLEQRSGGALHEEPDKADRLQSLVPFGLR